MRKQRKIKLPLAIAIIVIVVGAANYAYSQLPQRTEIYVTKVVDGDTLDVQGGERVRLLYIDTPERGEPCYSEAKARLTELVDGRDVVLVKIGEDRDKYGRILRYVFVNGTNVNLLMVQEGWAHLLIFNQGPYHQQFLEAEQSARAAGGCVWK